MDLKGHAHALNLKEGGFDVTVGLRKGSKSWDAATEAGFTVKESCRCCKRCRYSYDLNSR